MSNEEQSSAQELRARIAGLEALIETEERAANSIGFGSDTAARLRSQVRDLQAKLAQVIEAEDEALHEQGAYSVVDGVPDGRAVFDGYVGKQTLTFYGPDAQALAEAAVDALAEVAGDQEATDVVYATQQAIAQRSEDPDPWAEPAPGDEAFDVLTPVVDDYAQDVAEHGPDLTPPERIARTPIASAIATFDAPGEVPTGRIADAVLAAIREAGLELIDPSEACPSCGLPRSDHGEWSPDLSHTFGG